MSLLGPLPPVPEPGIWRNWKGHVILVLPGLSVHSETMEPMVSYYELTDPRGILYSTPVKWDRPLSIWHQQVNKDGYEGPRFSRYTSHTWCIAGK